MTENSKNEQIASRIRRRLEDLGISARAASQRAGGSPDLVRNLMRAYAVGRDYSPRSDTLQDLAHALETTPGWLLNGEGNEQATPADKSFQAFQSDPTALPIYESMTKALYGGQVEAGAFRPVDDLDQTENHDPIMVPPDRNFRAATLVAFDVVGDSMNALFPRPILSGDRVICVDIRSIGGVQIRTGMVVVVERIAHGGHLRERSVKQVEFYHDRTEFCPRSTNDRYKPIVVPFNLSADDGEEVQVIALVRSIQNEISY